MARKKKEIEDKELTLEEAQNVIRRLAHPKHVNQEERLLKQAASVVLKEVQPEFEFGDEEDENVKIDIRPTRNNTSGTRASWNDSTRFSSLLPNRHSRRGD